MIVKFTLWSRIQQVSYESTLSLCCLNSVSLRDGFFIQKFLLIVHYDWMLYLFLSKGGLSKFVDTLISMLFVFQ